jgi:hypothetical protein
MKSVKMIPGTLLCRIGQTIVCDEIVVVLLCLFFQTKNAHLLYKSFSSSSSSSCRSLRSLKHGENGESGDRLKLQNDNLVIILTVAVQVILLWSVQIVKPNCV